MIEKWRFLDTGIHDCRYNMALDEAISISRSQNKVPNTLRFYRWNPSVVSIGYFQSMKNEVDIHACDKRKIDYIRRITGGGAVYHDTNGELTYSIIVDGQHRLISKDFQDTYKKLCEGLVKGLSYLNIPASFRPINDIIVKEKKISGNAQTRRRGIVLQHGTILRKVDPKLMFTVLKVPDEKIRDKLIAVVNERVTSIERYLAKEINFTKVKTALAQGFTEAFHITLENGTPTKFEEELTQKLIKEKYSQKEWNFKK